MTAAEIIPVVRSAGFDKYDKIKHSFVTHSDKTGVTLRPEALAAVAEKFPEYAASLPGAPGKPPRRAEHRKKSNRLYLRLGDVRYAIVTRWMREDGIDTAQDFLEACVEAYGVMHGKEFM